MTVEDGGVTDVTEEHPTGEPPEGVDEITPVPGLLDQIDAAMDGGAAIFGRYDAATGFL